ncbi:feruloyl-CoA synthase [soil metagenome]
MNTTAASPDKAVAEGAPYRHATVGGSLEATFEMRDDGSLIARSVDKLDSYEKRLTDRLQHFAETAPERTLVAKRVDGGDWRKVSYSEALRSARSIAQALIDMKLSVERPVMILSDNDIEHLLLALGSMLAGVPYSPISPAYSLVSQDFGKLRHIVDQITPGLVFAASGAQFGKAIAAVVPAGTPVVFTAGSFADAGITDRRNRSFADLLATEATKLVDEAHAAVGPDTIAKFLFTSGSTKLPKAVINTQKMMCANQQQLVQCLGYLTEEPPVLIDWLPWNHTFGSNHNVGLVINNGGTLYIDEGKPTPKGIGETLRNLREIAPTVYFNVPKGFEEIATALESDEQLRKTLFSRVKMFFFSGAGLSQPVWDKLEEMAVKAVGERIRMCTGLGMTETAPFAICANGPVVRSGYVGLPAPGMELKLVPVDGKLEVRYRGPNVTPGYWRAEEQTRDSFDDEGFYCSGDALKFIDPNRPGTGFRFDGRIAEDFKLSTGTFVSVGPLRAKVIAEGDPYVQDVVVAGINRDDIGLLIFPRLDACRELSGLGAVAGTESVLSSRSVREFFQRLVDSLFASGTGSASRVARAIVMVEPPAIDRGEITDKGSINQRAVLLHRDAQVEQLYARESASDEAVILPRK